LSVNLWTPCWFLSCPGLSPQITVWILGLPTAPEEATPEEMKSEEIKPEEVKPEDLKSEKTKP